MALRAFIGKTVLVSINDPDINNVVWNFDPVPFSENARNGQFDEFKAVGYRDGLEIGQHKALFTTTAK